MYNKLFSKIVRSSIWLEPTPTRLVWFMFIALMDEDGFVQFASVANVAHTARITDKEAAEAIKILESEDTNSADDDNAGRRIEHVPGGWMVLNAAKYRDLVTRDMIRQKTRERVARHRAKKKGKCNADVTPSNGSVMQSISISKSNKKESANESRPPSVEDWLRELEADQTYKGIDVRREYGKMLNWCKIRKKQATKRRFINWLNNAERPIRWDSTGREISTTKNVYGKNRPPPINDNLTDEQLAAERKRVRELSEQFKKQQRPQ